MNNKRDAGIDVAKGIGILLVIIGHEDIPSWFEDIIFSFHMPLFFILSGYFFKIENNQLIRIKKDARRLLLPYVVTMDVITLYMLFIHQGIKHDGWYYITNSLWFWIYPTGAPGGLNFSGPIWFLFALFWTKCSFNLIEHIHSKLRFILLTFIFLFPFVIYAHSRQSLPFSIYQGLTSLVFYWGGMNGKDMEIQ